MGPFGLGQVDADEHHRLPRPADHAAATCSTATDVVPLDRDAAGAASATARSASSFRASTCCRAPARWRTSSCRCSTAGVQRGERHAAGARRRWSGWGWATGWTTPRTRLSGGQQQRVAIARALVNEPKRHPGRRAHRQPRLAHQRRGDGALPGARPSAGITDRARHPRARRRHLRRPGDRRPRRPHRERPRQTPAQADPSTIRRRGRGMNGLGDAAGGAPGPAAQQAALLPHHPGDHHRRRRGDRHGGHRRGRARRGGGGVRLDGHQPPGRAPRVRPTPGGARGGFGSQPTLTWDDLRGHPHRGPQRCGTRCRTCAPARRSSARTQNWTTQVAGHRAGLLRDPQLADGARHALHRLRRGRRDQGGGARAQPWPRSSSAPAPTRWGSRCASGTSPSRWWRWPGARGRRPSGRTTTTWCSSPVTTFQAKIQGGLGKFIAGHDLHQRHHADHARRAQVTDAPARPPPHRRPAPRTTSRSGTWPRWPAPRRRAAGR